jgi:uncharacterized protein with PIN domain
MDRIVFGGYSIQDLLIITGVVIGLLLLFKILKKLFKRKDDQHMQLVHCQSCGWQGRVSRYAGRCPKCNKPLGDLKARSDS